MPRPCSRCRQWHRVGLEASRACFHRRRAARNGMRERAKPIALLKTWYKVGVGHAVRSSFGPIHSGRAAAAPRAEARAHADTTGTTLCELFWRQLPILTSTATLLTGATDILPCLCSSCCLLLAACRALCCCDAGLQLAAPFRAACAHFSRPARVAAGALESERAAIFLGRGTGLVPASGACLRSARHTLPG